MPPKHTVQIYIDSREAALIAILAALYPEGSADIITNKQLPVGDIRVCVDDVTVLLIERKTAADLFSSLCDTRFREQRARLIQLRKRKPWINLMYIFEGDVNALPYRAGGKITPQYLRLIQRELPYKYKIHTTFVESTTETIRYLGHIQECFVKGGAPDDVLNGVTDADGNQVGRKREIGPREFMRAVLTQIPGVSADKALVIVEKYHTLPLFIQTYQKIKRVKMRKLLLQELRVPGQEHRFGPKLSTKIYEHIFGLAADGVAEDEDVEPVNQQPAVPLPQARPNSAPSPAPSPLPPRPAPVPRSRETPPAPKTPPKKKRTKPLKQAVIMKRGARMSYGKRKYHADSDDEDWGIAEGVYETDYDSD